MSGVRSTRVARAFRRAALPLASYYAVTLAVPLANGAAPSGAFMEHALVVFAVPPIAIILGCAVHTIAHALARLWNTTSRRRRELALDVLSFLRRARRNLRERSVVRSRVGGVRGAVVERRFQGRRQSGTSRDGKRRAHALFFFRGVQIKKAAEERFGSV